MPFEVLGANATLEDFKRARMRDAMAVERVEQYKLQGRMQPALSTIPQSHSDVRDTDVVGDVLLDASYRYELVDDPIAGIVWERHSRGSITW